MRQPCVAAPLQSLPCTFVQPYRRYQYPISGTVPKVGKVPCSRWEDYTVLVAA